MHQCELVDARETSVLALVGSGHQPAFGGDPLGKFPQGRDFDEIDAVSPCIPWRVCRLVETIRELHAVKLAAGQCAQFVQLGRNRRQYPGGKHAREVGAQHAVGGVLIVEFGCGLVERHKNNWWLVASG